MRISILPNINPLDQCHLFPASPHRPSPRLLPAASNATGRSNTPDTAAAPITFRTGAFTS